MGLHSIGSRGGRGCTRTDRFKCDNRVWSAVKSRGLQAGEVFSVEVQCGANCLKSLSHFGTITFPVDLYFSTMYYHFQKLILRVKAMPIATCNIHARGNIQRSFKYRFTIQYHQDCYSVMLCKNIKCLKALMRWDRHSSTSLLSISLHKRQMKVNCADVNRAHFLLLGHQLINYHPSLCFCLTNEYIFG